MTTCIQQSRFGVGGKRKISFPHVLSEGKVIRIAAAATVLAAAIMSGNPEAAVAAAEDTYEQATN